MYFSFLKRILWELFSRGLQNPSVDRSAKCVYTHLLKTEMQYCRSGGRVMNFLSLFIS